MADKEAFDRYKEEYLERVRCDIHGTRINDAEIYAQKMIKRDREIQINRRP